MIKDNYTPKINQMEKIMKKWGKRSISPLGKITVIKTFIIPIFNLLFTALPNPSNATIELINNSLFDFLWNKNPKIKKTVVVKQFAEGGLKMINLSAFIKALKSTWLRRILSSDSKWLEILKVYLDVENKPKIFLKNWRPLTLLDTVYKLASGAIANRIKLVLDELINRDQTGFIKGRSIVENIRVIYDIMKLTEEKQIPGLILLIDFEKAFDSLSWNFLHKALEYLNFGDSVRQWIKMFYNGISSAVIQAGHLSSFFNIQRGCRQGDPLSPYLFVICAEFLAAKIKKNENIKGIIINGIEFKISQYADDTSVILDGTETSLNHTLTELSHFSQISGLKVNFDKTQLVWIGAKKYSTESIKTKWKLSWGGNKFRLLGINFNTELEDMIKDNYTPKINQMEKIMKKWGKRSISPLGKITVIKTFIIPIFNLLFTALPNPSNATIELINNSLFDFLWNKNPKIKKTVVVKQFAEGGLKMINLSAFIKALKSTWLRRILSSDSKWLEILKVYLDVEKLMTCNTELIKEKSNTINNQFWKDVLKSVIDIDMKTVVTEEFILKSSLFYNRNIMINGKPIFYKNWYEKGLRFVNDLIKVDGKFYKQEEINDIFGISLNFLQYLGIINSVKGFLARTNIKLHKKIESPFIPSHIHTFIKETSGTQTMYNILNANDEQPTGKNSWNEKFHFTDEDWKKIHSYPFSIIRYPAIQWFQLSISHNILVTNKLLVKMKIKNDPNCYYCESQEETIRHLLWTCNRIQDFLNAILQWLSEHNIYCEITEEFFMFGLDKKNKISKPLAIILLYAKYYIYITRCNQLILHIDIFKKKFLLLYKALKEISLSNNQLNEFYEEWNPYDLLVNSID